MKNFVILTTEGYAISPYTENSKPLVGHLQLLGFAFGRDKKEAVHNLVEKNDWVKEEGFAEVIAIALENGLKKEEYLPIEVER